MSDLLLLSKAQMARIGATSARGHEAKSPGLHALSGSRSIPDVTRTPYGARRIPQGVGGAGIPHVGRGGRIALTATV